MRVKKYIDPRLTTILRILRPLGKTLAIVPIENEKVETGELFDRFIDPQ